MVQAWRVVAACLLINCVGIIDARAHIRGIAHPSKLKRRVLKSDMETHSSMSTMSSKSGSSSKTTRSTRSSSMSMLSKSSSSGSSTRSTKSSKTTMSSKSKSSKSTRSSSSRSSSTMSSSSRGSYYYSKPYYHSKPYNSEPYDSKPDTTSIGGVMVISPSPTPSPTRAPTPAPDPEVGPIGPPADALISINVSITYVTPQPEATTTPQVREPTVEELAALRTATISFYNETMKEAFNTTFIEQIPLNFTDMPVPGVGWMTIFTADEVFSVVPRPEEVVNVIEGAKYEAFVINEASQAGPYFAQTTQLELVVGAVLKNNTNATTAPIVAPTQAPGPATPSPVRNTPAPVSDTPVPTPLPTPLPTTAPTRKPTAVPTKKPSQAPSRNPSSSPSAFPTESPSSLPTEFPTDSPTDPPTVSPGDNNPTFTPRKLKLEEEEDEDGW